MVIQIQNPIKAIPKMVQKNSRGYDHIRKNNTPAMEPNTREIITVKRADGFSTPVPNLINFSFLSIP